MNNEELRVRRTMETSDLPKLSKKFTNGSSLFQITWQLYWERMNWLGTKFSVQKLYEKFDKDNPMISLFTWTVMVPVGGTFCLFGWFFVLGLYKKRIRINQVNYSMNQYQKKAFLRKVFNKNSI